MTITTIATRLRDRAEETPAGVALRHKRLGIWSEVTWAQYWDRVLDVAHALLALDVEPGERVAVHSENRPEWVYVDVATVAVRAVTMGLYPTNPVGETAHLLEDSGAHILVAEDQEQVDKALAAADRVGGLQHIVYIEPRGVRTYTDPRLISWDEFVRLGRDHRAAHPGAVAARMAEATPADVMSLFYTSGTTGLPKGAMLSVANVEFGVGALTGDDGWVSPRPQAGDLLLSYLPLCHLAERITTVWFNLAAGCVVHFPESTDTVIADLVEVQPTIFLGVPRIWEQLHTDVHLRAANATRLKRVILRLGLAVADRIGARLVARGGARTPSTRLLYAFGWLFCYRPLKARVGLRRCRHALSASAGMPPAIVQFFMGIGVPVYQVYGTTEIAAVATATRPGRVKLGMVGEPLPGVELRLDEHNSEILVRHPGVFAGYHRNPAATVATKTEDGWLHTGDVGRWVDGTHLDVIDRLRDVLVTCTGVQVCPSEIENALKASPYIRDTVLVGQGRPHLGALIGIQLEAVGDWAQRQGIAYTTYRDLTEHGAVAALVADLVTRVNERLAPEHRLVAFRLLPKPLDHEDGELTATHKVKRAAVVAAFAELVEDLYTQAGPSQEECQAPQSVLEPT